MLTNDLLLKKISVSINLIHFLDRNEKKTLKFPSSGQLRHLLIKSLS